MTTAGLLLAGGRGSRMGGDRPKPLMLLAGRPLASHALRRLTPHLPSVFLSANDAPAFAGFGLPVVEDLTGGFAGPLAGLHAAGVHIAAADPEIRRVLAVPADTPFLPADLVARMLDGPPERLRVAACGGVLHPSVALWPLGILFGLSRVLADPSRSRAIRRVLDEHGYETVDFPPDPEAPDGDPFFNVNTPADLERAGRHCRNA